MLSKSISSASLRENSALKRNIRSNMSSFLLLWPRLGTWINSPLLIFGWKSSWSTRGRNRRKFEIRRSTGVDSCITRLFEADILQGKEKETPFKIPLYIHSMCFRGEDFVAVVLDKKRAGNSAQPAETSYILVLIYETCLSSPQENPIQYRNVPIKRIGSASA